MAMKAGLGGLAVVDHNTPIGAVRTAKLVSSDRKRYGDFTVVRGVEVSTSDGHLIGLGVTESPPPGRGAVETAGMLRDLGGIVVVPHFGRYISGITDAALVERMRPDGMEVLNRKSRRGQNRKAESLARRLGCGRTAGSDSHSMQLLGGAFVILPAGEGRTEDDVIEAVRRGRTEVGGRGATIPESASKMFISGTRWFKRRGKRV
jgi:predicted metal-dependent phosphoesterase TrpH